MMNNAKALLDFIRTQPQLACEIYTILESVANRETPSEDLIETAQDVLACVFES